MLYICEKLKFDITDEENIRNIAKKKFNYESWWIDFNVTTERMLYDDARFSFRHQNRALSLRGEN